MPKTPDYFHGKTIIITGAASGIGRATARIFAREGANVVCADLNEAGVRETAGEVNAKGSQALAVKTDVTSRKAGRGYDQARNRRIRHRALPVQFGWRRDPPRQVLEIDDALIEKTFDLNLKGTLYGMQSVLPHMLGNKFGVIVNVGSMAHRRGGPGSLDPLRGGEGRGGDHDHGRRPRVRQPGHPRAVDLARAGEDAISRCGRDFAELYQQFLNDIPMKRFGEPEEIGELVLFMCSDACGFMTADTVYVNGGGGWR